MQHEQLLKWIPSLYADLRTNFPEYAVEIRRDLKHANASLSSGDLSLFTKTLPKSHSDFLSALERRGAPPKVEHLGWLLRAVWDDPCSVRSACMLGAHRQMSHLLYKLELPYETSVEAETLNRFVSTETELASISTVLENSFSKYVQGLARSALAGVCAPSDSVIGRSAFLREVTGLTPRHGPGAVATGERLEEKWRFKRRYESLHQRFPYYDWFVCRGSSELLDRLAWYKGLDRVPYPEARVVLVPKDSRGPRLISEEPLELQFMQQAYFRWMKKWVRHPYLCGHVSFDDQDCNGQLSLKSSSDRAFATLDLKDASDRVSVELVSRIFPKDVVLDLLALRSAATVLPDGQRVMLNKYAPMGSSVCFPTLALTVWAITVAGLQYAKEIGEYDGDVYSDVFVYGDDVIIPSKAYASVRQALHSVGLRVNEKKSFVESYFRESCGIDAYYGVNITPTRVRRFPNRQSRKDLTYLACLSYVNSLRERGWSKAAQDLEKVLVWAYGDVAYTHDPEAYPGVVVPPQQPLNRLTRWSKARSRQLVLTEIAQCDTRDTKIRDRERLLRNLLGCAGDSPNREQILESVKLRKMWVAATR